MAKRAKKQSARLACEGLENRTNPAVTSAGWVTNQPGFIWYEVQLDNAPGQVVTVSSVVGPLSAIRIIATDPAIPPANNFDTSLDDGFAQGLAALNGKVYGGVRILGGTNNDVIDGSGLTLQNTGHRLFNTDGGAGNDTITGGANNDIFGGGSGNDVLSGGPGNDSIDGGAGNDVINGDAGSDTLNGGDGNDTITGGTGRDSMYGGNDADVVNADPADLFNGSDCTNVSGGTSQTNGDPVNRPWPDGTGANRTRWADVLNIVSATGDTSGCYNNCDFEQINGGAGNERIMTSTTNPPGIQTLPVEYILDGGNDFAQGGLGNDTLNTGDGDDTAFGAAGGDLFVDSSGNDTLLYTGANGGSGVSIVLGNVAPQVPTATTFAGGDATGDNTTSAYENVFGSNNGDYIVGNNVRNILSGQGGNDSIWGAEGNDFLEGGNDDDALEGGNGNDSMCGGDGNDTVEGERGNDTLNGGRGDDLVDGGLGLDSIILDYGNPVAFGGFPVTTGNDPINPNDQYWGGAEKDAYTVYGAWVVANVVNVGPTQFADNARVNQVLAYLNQQQTNSLTDWYSGVDTLAFNLNADPNATGRCPPLAVPVC